MTAPAAPVGTSHAVARPVGAISLGLGVSMILCAIVAPLWTWWEGPHPHDDGASIGLALAGLLTMAVGGSLWAYGRRASAIPLGRREALLVVTSVWMLCGLLGGLPYVIDAGMSPADAVFEAISGFTTTGATVVADIEGTLSRPTLLWRSLTQWFGGMGVIVLFVAIFPNIGVAARHLYRGEAPGLSVEPLQPRIAETGSFLWKIYAFLTVVTIGLYSLFGMSFFEAVCHGLTTTSTGGFSTLDASIGGFDAARVGPARSLGIELTASVMMLASGLNYAIYFGVLRTRSLRAAWRSTELRVYVALVVASTLLIAVVLWAMDPTWARVGGALREGLFTVATSITSTGYGVEGYRHFPPFALAVMILLMLIGGSAGSTAGGIKVVRVVLLAKLVWAQVRQSFRPNVVQVVRMDGKPVDVSVVLDVSAFLVLYLVVMALGVALVTLTDGVSVAKGFGAMLTTLSNMGPAPFHEVGATAIDPAGADNFAGYSSAAKLWFALAMIVGRLEFFTILALLVPDFWRR